MRFGRVGMACALGLMLIVGGCAGSQQRVRGAVRVVETSSSKPDWLEKRSLERGDQLLFVGSVNSVADLSLGEEQAEYQAKKTIASSIRETFQREFSTALTGANRMDGNSRLGQALESALSASTDRVQVRGVLPVERFWERLEMQTEDGVTYGYNVSMLVRMSKQDYERAKNQVLRETAEAEQIKADAAAKDLLERVRTKLGS